MSEKLNGDSIWKDRMFQVALVTLFIMVLGNFSAAVFSIAKSNSNYIVLSNKLSDYQKSQKQRDEIFEKRLDRIEQLLLERK